MTPNPSEPVALKPCPAQCLHTVDRGDPYVFMRRSGIWGVSCGTCACSTEYYPTEAEAIAAWNTRPTTPASSELVERIVRDVAELPDRTSPDDWPDAMLVTAEELTEILLTALRSQPQQDTGGWIVGNGDGTLWRAWVDGSSVWVTDKDLATHYHRREDAEAVHREDEDAWTTVPYRQESAA